MEEDLGLSFSPDPLELSASPRSNTGVAFALFPEEPEERPTGTCAALAPEERGLRGIPPSGANAEVLEC